MTIFSFGYQSCTWSRSDRFCRQNPFFGCNSTIDLVVVLEYTFFQLCSNAEQISVRLTRFRRGYVNHPVVVLTNHTSYTSKWPHPFFCSCLTPVMVHLHHLILLSTPNFVYYKVGKQTKKYEIVIHIYIKTNSYSEAFHQPQNNVFSKSPFSRGGNLFSFLCTLIWSVMN